MGDDNTESKFTFYSKVPQAEAELRLGFRMESLESKSLPVRSMIAEAGYTPQGADLDAVLETKEEVYKQIVRYIKIEGYPTEGNPRFKEANINDLVYATIHPILFDFACKTGRKLRLEREREVVSSDSDTVSSDSETEETVAVDLISMPKKKFIFIIEAKSSSLGLAMKQCLLGMKGMKDRGARGEVYGFITTGEVWRMLKYDGESFRLTTKFSVLFGGMEYRKETWMKDYSVLVDCMNVALSN